MGARGSKVLSQRDWLFGSRPRRLALAAVLTPKAVCEGWTKKDLALAAEVSPNGGIDEHVDGFVELGLLERRPDGRYQRVDPLPAVATDLRRLLRRLEDLPDGPRRSA